MDGERETHEDIAIALRLLREETGYPPYAEIVRRIARQRIREGVNPEKARPARTTVYDAFKLGRSRLNPQLIGEIATALGEDDDAVHRWRERCHQAHAGQRHAESVTTAQDTVSGTSGKVHALRDPLSGDATPTSSARAFTRIVLIIAICCAVNSAGFFLSEFLQMPLFLDMIGTAFAAMVLGPWLGVAAAIAYHLIGLPIVGLHSLAMLPVSIVGALLWGYGVQRFRLASTLSRYLLLNVIVGFACTLLAVPSIFTFYGGEVRHSSAFLIDEFLALGMAAVVAVALANFAISLFDKLVTGFIALAMIDVMKNRPRFITEADRRLSHMPSIVGGQISSTT